MIPWIVRLVLIPAGALANFFVARDAPNFDLIEGMIAVALIALIVVVLAVTRGK